MSFTDAFIQRAAPLGVDIKDVRDFLPRDHTQACETRPLAGVTMLVVHCSGSAVNDDDTNGLHYLSQAAMYHEWKDWRSPEAIKAGKPPLHGDGLMYTFAVARCGQIYATRDMETATWSQHTANKAGMAILCPCGFGQLPSINQINSLGKLLRVLAHHTPEIPATWHDVFGHGELIGYGNVTQCPGYGLRLVVDAFRHGEYSADKFLPD